MARNPEYAIIADAIISSLTNVENYYQKASDSDIFFIYLGEYHFFAQVHISFC